MPPGECGPICCWLHYRAGSTHSATILGNETRVKSVAILTCLQRSHGEFIAVNFLLSSFFFSWAPFPLFPFSFLNCEPLIQMQLAVFQFSFQFTHHLLSLSAACTFVFWLSKLFPCLYFYFCNFYASPSSPSPLLRPLYFSFSHFSVQHY